MKTPYQSVVMIPTNKLMGKKALEDPYKPFAWYKEMRERSLFVLIIRQTCGMFFCTKM